MPECPVFYVRCIRASEMSGDTGKLTIHACYFIGSGNVRTISHRRVAELLIPEMLCIALGKCHEDATVIATTIVNQGNVLDYLMHTVYSSPISITNRTPRCSSKYECHVAEDVRSTSFGRQQIQRYIAQGRLRWFGHPLRSPLNHPARAIYTFNATAAGWSRPRGAPRTRWSDVLSKDLK